MLDIVGVSVAMAGFVFSTGAVPPPKATFNNPEGVAIWNWKLGNSGHPETIYVADYQSVRKIVDGIVTTIAGPSNASSGGCPLGFADGIGAAARFNYITAIAVDQATGNIYVTEHTNNAIRKITPTGVVTTLAGQGPTPNPVMPSIDGIGAAATFNHPTGIAIDPAGQYLFVTDSYDYSVRRITIASRKVQTMIKGQYLGTNYPSGYRLSNPDGIWYLPGSPTARLYIVDQGYGRVRYVNPGIFTGTALSPSVLSIVPGPVFNFNYPAGIAVDSSNQIFLTEGNGMGSPANQIRKGPFGGPYPVVAGGSSYGDSPDVLVGSLAKFNTPGGLAFGHGGYLYVADQRNNRIKRMRTFAPYGVSVFAGHEPGNPSGCRNGAA